MKFTWYCGKFPKSQQSSCHRVRPLPVTSCVTLVNCDLFGPQLFHQESEGFEPNKLEHLLREPSLSNPAPQNSWGEAQFQQCPLTQGLPDLRGRWAPGNTPRRLCKHSAGVAVHGFHPICTGRGAASQIQDKNHLPLASRAGP